MSLIKRFLSLFYSKVPSVIIPEMSDVERASRNIPPPKPLAPAKSVSRFHKKECDGKCSCGRSHMKSEYGCTKTFLKSPTAKVISTPMKIREGSSKPARDDIGMSGYKSRRDYDDANDIALSAMTTALVAEASSSSSEPSYTPSESYSPSSSDSYSSSSSSSDSSSSSGGGDGW